MNILVANNHLNQIGGSETFTFALIEELKFRNHNVEYFTFKKGVSSLKIENLLKVGFMSKSKYDLILANHNSCVKHLSYKGLTVQTCHGIFPKLEYPSRYADIHISISNEVENHLKHLGFKSHIIHNGINCKRFTSTSEINRTLKNVLSLSQSDIANNKIEKACKELNINFSKLNKFRDSVWDIECKINTSDLVVGLGRSAYDAMACGRNVLIFDERKYAESFADGLLSPKNVNSFLYNNCSGRYLKLKYSIDNIKEELKKYDYNYGIQLREFALEYLNIKTSVDKYLSISENSVKQNSFFKLRLASLKFYLELENEKIKYRSKIKRRFKRIKKARIT